MGNCLPLCSLVAASHASGCLGALANPLDAAALPGAAQMAALYKLGAVVGRGHFGTIRRCTDLTTVGTVVTADLACKSIPRCKLLRQQDAEDVLREIQCMRELSGHAGVVRLLDAFQDPNSVHLVMELCQGGDLFDQIVRRKAYPEREAATIMKSLVEVVQYCHSKGIMHRDLKPENILLTTANTALSEIKLADFGLALRFSKGEKFTGMAGSAYYIAPEILEGEYSSEVDIWSAGVILYILLSGVPPFAGETNEEIFEEIRKGSVDLSSDRWGKISGEAKDLIRKMLTSCVEKRITSAEILEHPWISMHTTSRPCESTEHALHKNTFSSEHDLADPDNTSPRLLAPSGSGIGNDDATYLMNTSSSRDCLLDQIGHLAGCASKHELHTRLCSVSSSLSSESSSSPLQEGAIVKWMSFCNIVGLNSEDLLVSVVPHLERSFNPEKVSSMKVVEGGHSCGNEVSVLNSEMESLMVEYEGSKFFVAIDRRRKRIGWKEVFQEVEGNTSFNVMSSESSHHLCQLAY